MTCTDDNQMMSLENSGMVKENYINTGSRMEYECDDDE